MTSHLERFAMVFVLWAVLSATCAAAAAMQTPTTQDPPKLPATMPVKNDYSNGDSWLCRPGRQDACAVDLTTTVIAPDGTLTREPFAANPNAPIYRQVTLTALRAGMAGKPMAADRILAYNDVLDAWNYYLEHDNHGRGVVLIGHSQGSGILTFLIRN